MKALKRTIRRIIQRLGYDVTRYRPDLSEKAQLTRLLQVHQVSAVLDVGANIGEYGQLLREGGYRGQIVSFEPLSAAHKELCRISAGDAYWSIAPRGAVGSTNGQAVINVAGNSKSSSILDMLPAHVRSAPTSRYVAEETVELARLDVMALQYLKADSSVFLKIDTQGYEKEVLEGATGILDRIIGLQLEMTLVPLYAHQPLFEEMLSYVKTFGFEINALFRGFVDPETGRALQFDVVFFRPQQQASIPQMNLYER